MKYYYYFKNERQKDCITAFTENCTVTTKGSRTSHAQHIFHEGMQKDALQVIINSNQVDYETITRARDILKYEV